MRRNLIMLVEEAKSKFSGYLSLYYYRLANLCVKADPVVLLSFEVIDGKASYGIEKVAKVSQPDDFSFQIFPLDPSLIKPIGQSIMTSHPEFKQDIQTLKRTKRDGSEEEVEFIKVSMPEIDDNRYEALKQGVDLLTKEFKAQIDITKEKFTIKLATYSDMPEDELKECNDELADLYDQTKANMEGYEKNKLNDIEEAHNDFLTAKTEKEHKKQKEEKEKGRNAGMSMRLFGNEDD